MQKTGPAPWWGPKLDSSHELDLKLVSKLFGLWDDIYRKEVVRFLEQARRWDPTIRSNGKKKSVKVKS